MTVVVFDVGNVLLRWNPRNLFCKVFANADQMEWFLSHVCDGSWNEAQDRGRAWVDAVQERTKLFPQWEAEIRAYDERWIETLDGTIEENVSVLRALKGMGVPVFAITNFSKEKFLLAREHHNFLELFDGIIVSGEEQLIKPDPRIFRLFLDRYRLSAVDCIFIDDSLANVAAAEKLGMEVIHYTESTDLRAALAKMGVLLAGAVHTL